MTLAENRSMQRRRLLDGSGLVWLFMVPLFFMLLLFAVPLAATFAKALSSEGLSGIAEIATRTIFLEAVERTVLLASVVTVIVWILGTLYSLALVLTHGWLRAFLLFSLLITFWISLLVRTYGWILLYQPKGALYDVLHRVGLVGERLELLQTTLAMYPAMVHIMLPYMVLPVFASLLALDPQKVRAAQSLGAGPLLVLRRVVLPQLRPGTIAGVILVFILSLGFFITPQFLGGPDDLTIATLINLEFSRVFDFGSAAAMGSMLLLGVVVAYVVADWLFKVSAAWGAS